MSIFYRHISQLVWRHGVASVPGVGVFSISRTGARFVDGVLHAPAVSVTFEPCETADGDMLVKSVVRREGWTEDRAAAYVSHEATAMQSVLFSGSAVEIPGVGTLARDTYNSGRLALTPFSITAPAPVAVKPLQATTEIPAETDDTDRIDLVAEALRLRREALARSLRRTASSAAAIAVFALVVFVLSQLPSRSRSDRQEAAIAALPATHTDDPIIEYPGAAEPALVLVLNTPADGAAPAKQRTPRHEAPADEPGRYCLVVASLASQSEAETFIRAHSTTEFPLSILDQQGRWRVYAMSGPSVEELSTLARNTGIYDKYPSAWICRRR